MTNSIVTFRSGGTVVGVGFLVSDRHIVTSAHVINAVLGHNQYRQTEPADTVVIEVEFAQVQPGLTRQATVTWWSRPPALGATMTHAGDLAGLTLLPAETPPVGATPLKLMTGPKPNSGVKVFGHQPGGQADWTNGTLLGDAGQGLVELNQTLNDTLRARPTHSGSPVVDTRTGRAVGVVTAIDQNNGYAVAAAHLRERWPEPFRNAPLRRGVRWTVGAALVAVLALVAVWALRQFPGEAGTARSDCVDLDVLVSTEKDELLVDLARKYNESEHDGPCARVRATGLTSGVAMDLIGKGWPAGQVDRLPAPQVWLPTSSMWTGMLREGGHGDLVAQELGPVTTSVLAVAMPEHLAKVVRADGEEFSWERLRELAGPNGDWQALGHPELGPFTLGRDNPNYSTSGLAASVATYFAAADRPAGPTAEDLTDGDVVQFVRDIETSVVRYGDEATTFMRSIYDDDQQGARTSISAVLVQEQLVHLYNRGAPLGDLDAAQDRPNEPMVALQPEEGTVQLDHPFVVLSSASQEQREAAVDFRDFLVQDEQQRQFVELGFRDLGRPDRPTDVLVRESGVPADSTQTFFEIPEPELVTAMRQAWDGTRRAARVLLVLDVSESMLGDANPDDAATDTKLDLLRPAAKRGLELLGDQDEVGIWTFAGPVTRVLELSPVGEVRGQLDGIIDDLPTAKNTSLYRAIREANQTMLATIDRKKINAIVVLSDGAQVPEDAAGLQALKREIDAQNLETSVRVFTIPYGTSDEHRTLLSEISGLSKAVSYDATNPDDIDEVMVSVFSNFGS
ncbi:substrate-binding domain-containing protein [Actinophytocola xinjiangensis]|uniref:substrate-binding domain-containing protein n=1 Tax=Actinophytocola xinjiangensis TaxID=485602 RepID=UPI0009FEF088|nr:extracellular solute-binding protein [Actinophytocola xinjiangensis]